MSRSLLLKWLDSHEQDSQGTTRFRTKRIAERSNTAIGEASVDGRALHWEYFQSSDLISEEELKTLTVEEMRKLEAEEVERNAWRVTQDVVSRIDGEPGQKRFSLFYSSSKALSNDISLTLKLKNCI